MSTTSYEAGPLHGGAVLAMVDGNGQVSVVQIPADSTVSITPLRTAPSPQTVLSGANLADAMAVINAQLSADGAV